MHRLISTLSAPVVGRSCVPRLVAYGGLVVACGGLVVACGGKKAAESPTNEAESASPGGDGDPEGADAGAPKKDPCVGFDLGDLDDLLAKSDCEVPDAKPESLSAPDMKGKLDVTVAASPTKIAPGGKVDLVVTFTNKTATPMPLSFRIDPLARFETEAYDAKSKRADVPPGHPPSPPKGYTPPPPVEAKVARVTIAPNGSARVRVPWEAVKTKWAPEKVRGTPAERGFPRSPAGPLAKGKYTVKVVTPLIGVFEGSEHEISAPKVDIEVAR